MGSGWVGHGYSFGSVLHIVDDQEMMRQEERINEAARAAMATMPGEVEKLAYLFRPMHSHRCSCGAVWGPCERENCGGPNLVLKCPWHHEYVKVLS
jgi:hypothetical protein